MIDGSQSNLAGDPAHELHNLIAVIIAEAQLLQLDFPKDGPNYLSAAAIERAGRQLELLVDRLTAARMPSHNKAEMFQKQPKMVSILGCEKVIEGTENGANSGY